MTKRFFLKLSLLFSILLVSGSSAYALSRKAPDPLPKRIADADKVFLGTITKRIEKNGWIHAELTVDEAFKDVVKKDKVKVVWRIFKWNGKVIFDQEKGAQGVAILKHQHEGRYWLRSDTFESTNKLKEVKSLTSKK